MPVNVLSVWNTMTLYWKKYLRNCLSFFCVGLLSLPLTVIWKTPLRNCLERKWMAGKSNLLRQQRKGELSSETSIHIKESSHCAWQYFLPVTGYSQNISLDAHKHTLLSWMTWSSKHESMYLYRTCWLSVHVVLLQCSQLNHKERHRVLSSVACISRIREEMNWFWEGKLTWA